LTGQLRENAGGQVVHIRILGCHGSDGLLRTGEGGPECNTCGFLLEGTVLLDAGTVAAKLLFEEQKQIRHVLLSHLHFDHIKGLPTFADNLSEDKTSPVTIAAIPEVIAGLKRHIFNTTVYPDFFTIPSAEAPTLVAKRIEAGKPYAIEGLEITPILVNHTVPAVGFIIRDQNAALLYSGDTYLTDEIWSLARRTPSLKAAFIECSYPNARTDLARISKHLTPSLLEEQFHKIGRADIAVYAYHLKPVYKDQIIRELKELSIPQLRVLEEGQTISI
jgi:ribonuclease BN (tRNA processing enzyme)